VTPARVGTRVLGLTTAQPATYRFGPQSCLLPSCTSHLLRVAAYFQLKAFAVLYERAGVARTRSSPLARVLGTVRQSQANVFLQLSTEGRAHWDDTGWRWETQGETLKATQACYHFGDEILVGHGDLESELWPVSHSGESAPQRRLMVLTPGPWGPRAQDHTPNPGYNILRSHPPQCRGPVPGSHGLALTRT